MSKTTIVIIIILAVVILIGILNKRKGSTKTQDELLNEMTHDELVDLYMTFRGGISRELLNNVSDDELKRKIKIVRG